MEPLLIVSLAFIASFLIWFLITWHYKRQTFNLAHCQLILSLGAFDDEVSYARQQISMFAPDEETDNLQARLDQLERSIREIEDSMNKELAIFPNGVSSWYMPATYESVSAPLVELNQKLRILWAIRLVPIQVKTREWEELSNKASSAVTGAQLCVKFNLGRNKHLDIVLNHFLELASKAYEERRYIDTLMLSANLKEVVRIIDQRVANGEQPYRGDDPDKESPLSKCSSTVNLTLIGVCLRCGWMHLVTDIASINPQTPVYQRMQLYLQNHHDHWNKQRETECAGDLCFL